MKITLCDVRRYREVHVCSNRVIGDTRRFGHCLKKSALGLMLARRAYPDISTNGYYQR
jgi:hypothetical protein